MTVETTELLRELARVKVMFQQRAIAAHMGFIMPTPAGGNTPESFVHQKGQVSACPGKAD